MKLDKVKELHKICLEIKKLQRKAGRLRNSREVEEYNFEVNSRRALSFVKKELKEGNMVWCRNADICHLATPCINFDCGFKKNKYDVAKGCSKCHRFQVTLILKEIITEIPSTEWGGAMHINAKWMESLAVGW